MGVEGEIKDYSITQLSGPFISTGSRFYDRFNLTRPANVQVVPGPTPAPCATILFFNWVVVLTISQQTKLKPDLFILTVNQINKIRSGPFFGTTKSDFSLIHNSELHQRVRVRTCDLKNEANNHRLLFNV